MSLFEIQRVKWQCVFKPDILFILKKMVFKRSTYWCEKYNGVWVNEQTGPEKGQVFSEAVSSLRAASTEHAQTGCAPASLFHAKELAERAEHTH